MIYIIKNIKNLNSIIENKFNNITSIYSNKLNIDINDIIKSYYIYIINIIQIIDVNYLKYLNVLSNDLINICNFIINNHYNTLK